MAYIGNQPALQYITFAKQTFTANGSTVAFTLDNSVANENELEVFVNNVRQEPGSGKAYTASGTTLTMSAAPNTGDDFYCIYQGKATQTVTPGASTVTNAMLSGSIANAKLANSSITLNSSAVSLGGSHSIVNTPAFFAFLNANQGSFNDTTFTKVAYNDELFDSGSGFDTSTGTYTIPSAGKYLFSFQVRKSNFSSDRLLLEVRLNGSGIRDLEHGTHSSYGAVTGSFIKSFSANDTIEAYIYQQSGATRTMRGGSNAKDTWIYGFKIIE